MLTTTVLKEILSKDNDIINYKEMKEKLTSGKLTSVSSDTVLRVMIKALSAYDKIMEGILEDMQKEEIRVLKVLKAHNKYLKGNK